MKSSGDWRKVLRLRSSRGKELQRAIAFGRKATLNQVRALALSCCLLRYHSRKTNGET